MCQQWLLVRGVHWEHKLLDECKTFKATPDQGAEAAVDVQFGLAGGEREQAPNIAVPKSECGDLRTHVGFAGGDLDCGLFCISALTGESRQ